MCESEISRADRYHHSFACILFKIVPLDALFEENPKKALALVDEITQGLRTRTRKTDYGTWLDRSTLALLSLEGGQRIRFLIARATIYLMKDLAGVEGMNFTDDDVLVGSAIYPGNSRTANDLVNEARANLQIHSRD